MRRGRREKKENYNTNIRVLMYISGGIVVAIILTFIITFAIYNKKVRDYSYSSLTTEKIADLVPNTTEDVEEELKKANSDIGKSIEEVINELEDKEEKVSKPVNLQKEETKEQDMKQENVVVTSVVPEKVKDPEFVMPVDGEIVRDFAKDSLIYSETLQEWIVHLGIDIKADRTTVVKASETGKVLSIKNDPRYGLTIVIEHVNGFKSVYSNLLTSEFVSEGENVEKGQTIGTVGNSAPFEILDEPHLHFEIIKDNVNVNPKIYIK